VNTKRNIFSHSTGQVFAREVFLACRANQRGVAFNHSAACKASSIAYRCYTTAQYAEPVIGRAYEIDHHDLGFD
jgi:hypothetical protein